MRCRQETELLIESMLREDKSVGELLDADYTFVNQRLAEHYGIAGVYGTEFRRVPVSDENRRGLLGHASILTVTSYPNRTAPTIRGKWVLEQLLGAPPPPPPPNVPTLAENEGDDRTVHARAHGAAPRQSRLRGLPSRHGPDGLRAREFRRPRPLARSPA